MIRILIADAQNLFRKGLSAILNEENNIAIVGLAGDVNDLFNKYEQTNPDLIITDVSMPGKNGLDAIKKIRRSNKKIKILFLSEYSGDHLINLIINSGGQGLLNKDADLNELLFAINEIVEGRFYFIGKSNSELDTIRKRFEIRKEKDGSKRNNNLTKREEEILLMIAQNMTNFEIASKLKLSPRTIEGHRSRIIKKFKLNSLGGLINFAIEYSIRIKSEKGILYN